MITLILFLVIVLLLDVATLRWGHDSRDGIDSAEWVRRQEWSIAHLVHTS
jgi:hypothetical protein